MGNSIFDAAVKYLSYRSRTEKEVYDYLVKKDFRRDKIPETIEKLKGYKYIDDTDYVLSYIDYNSWGNRYGKRRMRVYLQKKGISEENMELLDSEVSDEEEMEYCRYHFNKALERTDGQTYSKRVPKIIGYLQRRGFGPSLYRELISEVPKTAAVDQDDFERHLDHYMKMYTRKGFEGRQWRDRVVKGMMGRGYRYSDIREALERLEE